MAVVALVVGLTIAALIAAFVLPVGIQVLTDDSTQTATQEETDTVVLSGPLEATVTTIDAGDVTVEVEDTETSSSDTVTVSEGQTETAIVEGEEIGVTAKNVGDTTADMEYTYPTTYGWGDGASSLWNILDIIVVLAVFLMFIGIAMAAVNQV